jgi:hypothetical protein
VEESRRADGSTAPVEESRRADGSTAPVEESSLQRCVTCTCRLPPPPPPSPRPPPTHPHTRDRPRPARSRGGGCPARLPRIRGAGSTAGRAGKRRWLRLLPRPASVSTFERRMRSFVQRTGDTLDESMKGGVCAFHVLIEPDAACPACSACPALSSSFMSSAFPDDTARSGRCCLSSSPGSPGLRLNRTRIGRGPGRRVPVPLRVGPVPLRVGPVPLRRKRGHGRRPRPRRAGSPLHRRRAGRPHTAAGRKGCWRRRRRRMRQRAHSGPPSEGRAAPERRPPRRRAARAAETVRRPCPVRRRIPSRAGQQLGAEHGWCLVGTSTMPVSPRARRRSTWLTALRSDTPPIRSSVDTRGGGDGGGSGGGGDESSSSRGMGSVRDGSRGGNRADGERGGAESDAAWVVRSGRQSGTGPAWYSSSTAGHGSESGASGPASAGGLLGGGA